MLAVLAPGVVQAGGIGAGTGPSVGGQRTRNRAKTAAHMPRTRKH